jgi:hypothetical protein
VAEGRTGLSWIMDRRRDLASTTTLLFKTGYYQMYGISRYRTFLV